MENEKKGAEKPNPFRKLGGTLKNQLLAIVYFMIPVSIGVVLVRILWEWIKFVWNYPIF